MVSTPWRSRRTMTSPRSCRRPKTTAYSRQSAPIASIGNAQSMDRNASSAYPITEKSESSTMAHTHIAARDNAKSVVTRYPLIGSRTTSCTRAGISGISGISDTKSESTHRSSLVPRSFLARSSPRLSTRMTGRGTSSYRPVCAFSMEAVCFRHQSGAYRIS